MSLATRCSSCKTVFRVVQDQLKVSEGWVRCGRCGTVFNALQALFNLDRNVSTRLMSDTQGRSKEGKKRSILDGSDPVQKEAYEAAHSGNAKRFSLDETDSPIRSKSKGTQAQDLTAGYSRRRKDGTLGQVQDRNKPEQVAATKSTPPGINIVVYGTHAQSKLKSNSASPPSAIAFANTVYADPTSLDEALDDFEEDHANLEFVRKAERQARWQSPSMRRLLMALSGLMLILLCLQVLHHFRDLTVAKWPRTLAVLTPWCEVVGCQINPPKDLSGVVVESITLLRQAQVNEEFLLTVVLRNQADFAVLMPSLDLTLRDARGLLLMRRMLHPTTLNANSLKIEPSSETQLQAMLIDKEQRIVGYTVEAFYP